MKALNQLEIPKRSFHCFHKKEPLLPGMEIISLIYEDENQEIGRHDYCAACWPEAQAIEGSKPETRGYWKSKIEPKKIVPESTRVGRGLSLLKEMLKTPEADAEEVFVLCLFLSHARQLALRQEFKEEGSTFQLYEILRQDEFITVKLVNLSTIQIENIQKSLAQKLSLSHAA